MRAACMLHPHLFSTRQATCGSDLRGPSWQPAKCDAQLSAAACTAPGRVPRRPRARAILEACQITMCDACVLTDLP